MSEAAESSWCAGRGGAQCRRWPAGGAPLSPHTEHTLVPTGEQQGESSHDLLVHRGLSAEKKPLMVYGGT